MKGKKQADILILSGIIIFSTALKLLVVFKCGNTLTLGSDDLNYVKSAVYLLKSGLLTYHNYDEPTVFIMPLYPFFLWAVFGIFGWGTTGMMAFRIIQCIISSMTVVLVYLLGRRFFNSGTGILASVLAAFYFPSVITASYALTETIFTFLLILLVYLSIAFCDKPGASRFCQLGLIWTIAVLCRPTVGLYPVFLFIYFILRHKPAFKDIMKMGFSMALVFLLLMLPWWARNYREYGLFIPLAASSGNPMLQGTYINYEQTPENTVYYMLGKTAIETNKTEVEIAKKKIGMEFRRDFWGYLRWFTVGKTNLLWSTVFYWRTFLGISHDLVMIQHSIILLGFGGIIILIRHGFIRYMLPVAVIIYFNIVHCVYMAFDRYAFPLLPFLCIFSAFLLSRIYISLKQSISSSFLIH